MTIINYKGFKIEVKKSGTGAHVARIYHSGSLKPIREIFTLWGEANALQGAKNRIHGFDLK